MIEVNQLSCRYRSDALALDNVSFDVKSGEVYGILGAAGAGKTSLLNVLLGGLVPTRGHASIAGINVTTEPRRAKALTTFIRARGPLYGDMTARQNVVFFMKMGAPGPLRSSAEMENAMRRAGVPERLFDRRARDLPPHLSTLIWLAIAALRDTPAVVVDEPTVGVDPVAAEDIHDCLDALRTSGKAVLVTTTDVVLVTRAVDRIGVLQRGRKIAEHSRAELLDQRLTDFLFDYGGRRTESAAGHGP